MLQEWLWDWAVARSQDKLRGGALMRRLLPLIPEAKCSPGPELPSLTLDECSSRLGALPGPAIDFSLEKLSLYTSLCYAE